MQNVRKLIGQCILRRALVFASAGKVQQQKDQNQSDCGKSGSKSHMPCNERKDAFILAFNAAARIVENKTARKRNADVKALIVIATQLLDNGKKILKRAEINLL